MYVMYLVILKEGSSLASLMLCPLDMAPWVKQTNTSFMLNPLLRLECLLVYDRLASSMQMLFVLVIANTCICCEDLLSAITLPVWTTNKRNYK